MTAKAKDLSQLIPMPVAMSEFSRFLDTELGCQVLSAEKHAVDLHMPGLVGYNLLQLSVQKATRVSDAARVGHYIKMGFAPSIDRQSNDNLWADYQTFPIATDCIDIALLHHVLEFAKDPHQVLREADRTLTAGGHMLLIGFNPVSCWTLYKHYAGLQKSWMLTPQLIRSGRLADWLAVLNYDVLHQQSYFFRPPFNSPSLLNSTHFMDRLGDKFRLPFGLFYLIVARKKSIPLSFIRSYWPRSMNPVSGVSRQHQSLHRHRKTEPASNYRILS